MMTLNLTQAIAIVSVEFIAVMALFTLLLLTLNKKR